MSNKTQFFKSQLIAEIDLIPEDKLEDLYKLINKFRIRVNSKDNHDQIMQFAGAWKNLSDEEFDNEMEKRRQNSFIERFRDET